MAMSVVQQDTSPIRAERCSEDYTIGIICALPTELAAATEMLDEEHPCIMQNLADGNSYQFGRIGGHDVVIGALPCGSTGPVSAAGVALNMKSAFRDLPKDYSDVENDLQIKRLRACSTAKNFQDALDTIPESLEETYHRALATIPHDNRTRVQMILSWLISSYRELTTSEVAAVVKLPFVEDVFKFCPSALIVVTGGDTQTIKLAHLKVKEFLITGPKVGLRWYRIPARVANCVVAAQALKIVFGCTTTESKDLLDYASRFWPAHERQLHPSPGLPTHNDVPWGATLLSLIDDVEYRVHSVLEINKRERSLKWLETQFPEQIGPPRSNSLSVHPIHYASLLGLESSVMHFWHDFFYRMVPQLGDSECSISDAACMGYAEIVKWLTDRTENPSGYFDLPRIARRFRINPSQTLHALLNDGSHSSIGIEVVSTLIANPRGDQILGILLEQKLAFITEKKVRAYARSERGKGILEMILWYSNLVMLATTSRHPGHGTGYLEYFALIFAFIYALTLFADDIGFPILEGGPSYCRSLWSLQGVQEQTRRLL